MEPESLECAITGSLPFVFKGPGVYGIRHSASGRIYVGIAKDIRSRLHQHLGALLAVLRQSCVSPHYLHFFVS